MSGFLTVNDFLLRFRISRSTFYREVAAGRISVIKIGTATRIPLDEAERWAASLQTKSPTQISLAF